MADLAGAKSFYDWIVEPDSDEATWNARKIKQDSETVTNYSDCATMFQDISDDLTETPGSKGGTVGIRNGEYTLDVADTTTEVITWGNDATENEATVVLQGESREGVVFKNVTDFVNACKLFYIKSNLEMKNLTINGDDLGTATRLTHAATHGAVAGYISAENCKFMKHTSFGFRAGYEELWAAIVVKDCEFYADVPGGDQCSMHPHTYGKALGNYFNRIGDGSQLTPGQSENVEIGYNVIDRQAGFDDGISIEPYEGVTNGMIIHHNIMTNGVIKVGQSGAWGGTIRNVGIYNNQTIGGNIQVFGPTSGSQVGRIKNVFVENNKVMYPPKYCIKVNGCDGLVTIKDNLLVDSNSTLTTPGADTGLMRLANSKNIICEDNTLIMGVTSPEDARYSSHGIRYESLTDFVIQRNRIFNYTLAPNPPYVSAGTHSGKKVISQDLS